MVKKNCFLVISVTLILTACSSEYNANQSSSSQPSDPPITQATHVLSSSNSGKQSVVTVSPAQAEQEIKLQQGQMLVVDLPGLGENRWHVEYEHSIIRREGSTGWQFRAMIPGDTQLSFTSMPNAENGSSPARMRITFLIKVE